jgi:hypothetical protein
MTIEPLPLTGREDPGAFLPPVESKTYDINPTCIHMHTGMFFCLDHEGRACCPECAARIARERLAYALAVRYYHQESYLKDGLSVADIDQLMDSMKAAGLPGDMFAQQGRLHGFRNKSANWLESEYVDCRAQGLYEGI